MEVLFIIMGFNTATIILLGILVKNALDMETLDQAHPTGQTLNGGAN